MLVFPLEIDNPQTSIDANADKGDNRDDREDTKDYQEHAVLLVCPVKTVVWAFNPVYALIICWATITGHSRRLWGGRHAGRCDLVGRGADRGGRSEEARVGGDDPELGNL